MSGRWMRRDFVRLLAGAAIVWPLPLIAQQTKKPTIGFLFPGPAVVAATRISALLEGLRWAGYREPEQVELVARIAEGDTTRIAPMAAELVDRKVDLIVTVSPVVLRAVRSASATIPIVAHDLETDPVGSGTVASLARPGGNVTGVFFDFPEFSKKWLELLKESIPQLESVAVFWDPATGPTQMKAVEMAAKVLNLRLDVIEVQAVAQLDAAFRSARRHGALLMLSSPVIGQNAKLVADLTFKHQLPAVTLFADFARAGGLMAYGTDLLDTFRQLGGMVAKVLRGMAPADLPVERPTKFALVVNLKTAKSLGLVLPPSILLRADEVIE
jgi:putative tryptophan/tyrosine transport system substrate-binding protein